jgi:hypothetical protein
VDRGPRVDDPEVQRALEHLYEAVDRRANAFPTVGTVLRDVLLDTAEVGLFHKLGRKPYGWVVLDRDGTANIYRSRASTKERLFLKASASVVADIWVI